jgi:hypothetical protein
MGALTAVLAPVFGSATGTGRALRECDAAVRVPLPVCRRVGFVHLAPGSGGSTAAAEVATVLARRRTGTVLAVDASPSPRGLLPLLGAAPSPAGRRAPTTAAEARAGLATSPSGAYALDLRPAGDWPGAVGPIARFFDVVVTDWGLRHPAYDLEPVLATSHVVCLVVRADDAVPAAALLDALRARPGTPPIVVAPAVRRFPAPAVVVEPGPHHSLRLAAALMRSTGGDSRDR